MWLVEHHGLLYGRYMPLSIVVRSSFLDGFCAIHVQSTGYMISIPSSFLKFRYWLETRNLLAFKLKNKLKTSKVFSTDCVSH